MKAKKTIELVMRIPELDDGYYDIFLTAEELDEKYPEVEEDDGEQE